MSGFERKTLNNGKPNTKYIDLDGSFDLAEDLVKNGFSLYDGYMKINKQPIKIMDCLFM